LKSIVNPISKMNQQTNADNIGRNTRLTLATVKSRLPQTDHLHQTFHQSAIGEQHYR
jgi:hypothetical protein